MAAPLLGLARLLGNKKLKKAAKETGQDIGLGIAGVLAGKGLYGASEIIGKHMEKKDRKKLMKEGGSAARKLKQRFKNAK